MSAESFTQSATPAEFKVSAATPIPVDEDWQDGANCIGVDSDLFFPERGASVREAKEICRGCVVRRQCLEFALQNGEKFGIWGGLSERERRRIRRQRAQASRSSDNTTIGQYGTPELNPYYYGLLLGAPAIFGAIKITPEI